MSAKPASPHQEAVKRSIRLMKAKLKGRVRVDDLARAALYSTFHFTRVFARETGMSPVQFLRNLRVEEAQRLLRETDLPFTKITTMVGYKSCGTFTTVFGRIVGVSPMQYRKQARSKAPGKPNCRRDM